MESDVFTYYVLSKELRIEELRRTTSRTTSQQGTLAPKKSTKDPESMVYAVAGAHHQLAHNHRAPPPHLPDLPRLFKLAGKACPDCLDYLEKHAQITKIT